MAAETPRGAFQLVNATQTFARDRALRMSSRSLILGQLQRDGWAWDLAAIFPAHSERGVKHARCHQ